MPEYARTPRRSGQTSPGRVQAEGQGHRARVLVAEAIAHEPELIIADEPTSGLDDFGYWADASAKAVMQSFHSENASTPERFFRKCRERSTNAP